MAEKEASSKDLVDWIYSSSNFKDSRLQTLANRPTDILGYPVMFSETADPSFTYENHKYGRVEYNTLVRDMPLVFLQPGKTHFLPAKSMLTEFFGGQEADEAVYKALQELSDSENGDEAFKAIERIKAKTGMTYDSRYYGFKPAYDEYLKFVNSMSAYTLLRMNLHESNFRMSGFHRSSNWVQSLMVPIYADVSGTRYSESGSNSTTESMLAGFIKTAGSTSREIDFILNGQVANSDYNADSASKDILEKLGGLAEDLGGKSFGGTIDHLLTGAKTVINGGNLIFPEIWQDSQFKKSYDISIKLSSPSGDPLSVYNNVIHPMICLVALALPRMLNKQGYAAPFLIKAYSKGWFSCDMGMVESITITKGGSNNKDWTDEGYPLSAEITLTIKDLYPTLMQSIGKASDIYSFNTGLLEFLECMASTEPGQIDYMLNIKSTVFDSFVGLGQTFFDRIQASLQQTGIAGTIGNIIQGAGQLDDAFNMIVNQITGSFKNVADMFGASSIDKSSTINGTGNGNYTDIEIPTTGDNNNGDNNDNNNDNNS